MRETNCAVIELVQSFDQAKRCFRATTLMSIMYLVDFHAEPELYPCREPLHRERNEADYKDCASPKQARRKRVTFANADTFQDAVPPFSSHRKDLYWSRLEKRQFVAHAQCRARQLQGVNPAHLRSVADAWQHCHCAAAPSTLSRTRHNLADMQALIQWADSPGRGLEHKVFASWRRSKHHAVRKIVSCYEYLQSNVNTTDVSEALRAFSERRSFRAREFAVKMAVADLLVLDRCS
jgi:hypothetical protein